MNCQCYSQEIKFNQWNQKLDKTYPVFGDFKLRIPGVNWLQYEGTIGHPIQISSIFKVKKRKNIIM